MGATWAGVATTRHERRVLLACALPLAVGSLNLFGATLALTDLHDDFGLGFDHLRWALVAFLVPDALFLVLAGRLGDLVGRRRLMVGGAATFAVGAALAASAPGYGWLVAVRVVEGAGAGLLFGGLLAVIADAFPAERLGRAFAWWAFFGALAFCWSPLVGGAVVHLLGWRWIFALNAVLAVLTAVLVARDLDDDARRACEDERPGRDPLGFVLVGVGVVLVIAGTLQGPTWGWSSPATLLALAGGMVALGLGAVVERTVAHPLWPPDVLRAPGFLAGAVVVAAGYLAQELTVLIVAVYLFFVRDLTALEVGLVLLSYSVTWLVVSRLGGRWADRWGARTPVLVGLAAAAAGAVVLAASGSSVVLLCVGLVVLEAGGGLAVPPANAATMRRVPAERRGEASGVAMALRLLGSALGLAAGASVLLSRHGAILADEAEAVGADANQLEPASLGGLLDAWQPVDEALQQAFGGAGQLQDVAGSAYESAATWSFLVVAAVFVVVLAVAAVALRDEPGGRDVPA